MRRAWLIAVLVLAGACGDDTTSTPPDLGICLPLAGGNSICPHCDPGTGGSCGSEQENFQCTYGGEAQAYCVCHSGRWSCQGQPFSTPDFALPRD